MQKKKKSVLGGNRDGALGLGILRERIPGGPVARWAGRRPTIGDTKIKILRPTGTFRKPLEVVNNRNTITCQKEFIGSCN